MVMAFSEANYIKSIQSVIKNILQRQQGIELVDVSPRLQEQQHSQRAAAA
jgi:hypothetical protein